MALNSTAFIPQVWSSLMVAALYASTTLSMIANTNYEGEIKEQGNVVKVRITPHITIRDYTPGVDLEIDEPTKALIDLDIDKAKYFNFPAEYVEVKQSDIPFVAKFAESAGKDMKIAIEQGVYADIYSDAPAANSGTGAGLISGNLDLGTAAAPVSITALNIVQSITDLQLVLDEQNVPVEDRWLILPSWAHSILIPNDAFAANTSGDDKSALRKGKVGDFSGFSIYKSNNLRTVATLASGDDATQTNVIFGHKDSLTFATQLLINSEKVTSEHQFTDYYRGLHVYGYLVCQPESFGAAVWTRG